MSDIKNIKEMLTTMSGFGSITKGDILDLITTIESQKEEINRLVGLNIMKQSCIDHQDKQLGKLEAITELAVKELQRLSNHARVWNSPIIEGMADATLSEIERLQNE